MEKCKREHFGETLKQNVTKMNLERVTLILCYQPNMLTGILVTYTRIQYRQNKQDISGSYISKNRNIQP